MIGAGVEHQNVGIYRAGTRHTAVPMALGNSRSWHAHESRGSVGIDHLAK